MSIRGGTIEVLAHQWSRWARNPKPEARRPKEIRRPKSEMVTGARTVFGTPFLLTNRCYKSSAAKKVQFGFRISAFFRPSDFGFRIYLRFTLQPRTYELSPLCTSLRVSKQLTETGGDWASRGNAGSQGIVRDAEDTYTHLGPRMHRFEN